MNFCDSLLEVTRADYNLSPNLTSVIHKTLCMFGGKKRTLSVIYQEEFDLQLTSRKKRTQEEEENTINNLSRRFRRPADVDLKHKTFRRIDISYFLHDIDNLV